MGSGKHRVLALYSDDAVLAWIGPLGLALAAGTALVVDARFGTGKGRTVADFVDAGPRLAELSPGRRGVATIAAGPLPTADLEEAIAILSRSWPALVVRSDGSRFSCPTIVYRGAYPNPALTGELAPAVWQVAHGAVTGRLPGLVMPAVGRRQVEPLLRDRRPPARRWIRAWERVWEMPWA